MQKDFHYYATYCAAYIAGFSHEESLDICYSAQFVDWCSATLLRKIKGPVAAATTQLQLELMDARTDRVGLQDITRIWSSFHFLPYNLKATRPKAPKSYQDKYRLICNPNGSLLVETVKLAKDKSLQAIGIAMHVLADTWAHRYFAGTPSYAINNTNYHFFEVFPDGSEKEMIFKSKPGAEDDLDGGVYINSLFQFSDTSIMNLGHGRAGHLPDYSFIRYRYLPAWGDYEEIFKDNPHDYYKAFTQMIYAMKYLKGIIPDFKKDTYDTEAIAPWEDRINEILCKRQLDSCADWKAFGESLSGREIPDFDMDQYQEEYRKADKASKDDTYIGKFVNAALAQKSMVTNRIYKSGNKLAGISVDYNSIGFKGQRDYLKLAKLKKNRKE
jgi:hypothetical protein